MYGLKKYFFFSLIYSLVFSFSSDGWARTLRGADQAPTCVRALILAGKNDFMAARHALKGHRCPLTQDVITWLFLKNDKMEGSFSEYETFLNQHKEWPWASVLRKRAELVMGSDLSPERIVTWFQKNPPQTLKGLKRYVKALSVVGQTGKIRQAVRLFWQQGDFSAQDEKYFLEKFTPYLSAECLKNRLLSLLDRGKIAEAGRLEPYVSSEDRIYVKTRIALQKREDRAEDFYRNIQKTHGNDPGLAHDYLTWLRKQQDDRVFSYFFHIQPVAQRHPDRFWKERHILCRDALEAGDAEKAYMLASGHGLSWGKSYAEAEWLSGWIAFRFLNNPHQALSHFLALEKQVKTGISRGRANYWIGRVYEYLGQRKQAHYFYEKAGRYQATFYGQKALSKIMKRGLRDVLQPNARPLSRSFEKEQHLDSYWPIRVMRLLNHAGLTQEILPFAYLAAQHLKSSAERHYFLNLVTQWAPYAVVEVAQKIATHDPETFYRDAYPVLKKVYEVQKKGNRSTDLALVHALIRQESKFNPWVVSPVGAQGLMQLMIPTAREIAQKQKWPFEPKKLLSDPYFNVRLGSIYLQKELERYEGCLPLTLASYNAGLGTVQSWITRFSDPRDAHVDVVDWIESLPYGETRDYVHRVLENYEIYKVLLRQ